MKLILNKKYKFKNSIDFYEVVEIRPLRYELKNLSTNKIEGYFWKVEELLDEIRNDNEK